MWNWWPFKKEETVLIKRRGYYIQLNRNDYDKLIKDRISISIILDRKKTPSSVQLVKYNKGAGEKKYTYLGTLANYLNVEKFKDNNTLNFSHKNIIRKK